MNGQKLSYIIGFFFFFYFLTLIAACRKEYSYEGGSMQDSTILFDSAVRQESTEAAGITFPICKGCNSIDTSSAYKWSFKVGHAFLCGNVTKAVISPNGDAMTFFGPSACSEDSGLIITAYFNNQVLNKDQSNITADRAALEYYDNTTMSDILQSQQPNIFSLTINSYIRQTGVTIGTFSGSVADRNGNIIKIDSGKYTIKF